MKELPNIERASEHNFLWPWIADAVDTFLRRREAADAYERIWRLIHIWESITTVLSGAIAARLQHCGSQVASIHLGRNRSSGNRVTPEFPVFSGIS